MVARTTNSSSRFEPFRVQVIRLSVYTKNLYNFCALIVKPKDTFSERNLFHQGLTLQVLHCVSSLSQIVT